MAILTADNVSKVFNGSGLPVPALTGIDLAIEEGEFVALSGPSGSGKTTLLNLLGCLDKPTGGKIFLDGDEVSALSQKKLAGLRLYKIGFIFQDYNLIPTLTVVENIEYVLWLQGVAAAERRRRAMQMCERFRIAQLAGRRPPQVSRGQQQRAAVARAIVHKPRIVLGDELTANLDQKTGAELMDFLKELNRNEKITFVYASHDPVMLERAGRVVRIQDGKIVPEPVTAQARRVR